MASAALFFLDTNVLLYALSRADAETDKRRLARDWVGRRDRGLCAAKQPRARTVVSEDLSHGQTYRGVRVHHPFRGA